MELTKCQIVFEPFLLRPGNPLVRCAERSLDKIPADIIADPVLSATFVQVCHDNLLDWLFPVYWRSPQV
jgi:hypothetical protein